MSADTRRHLRDARRVLYGVIATDRPTAYIEYDDTLWSVETSVQTHNENESAVILQEAISWKAA